MSNAETLALLVVNLTGVIFPFAGASAPQGFLLCHGQAVSRSTYSDLFGVIGTAFGAGDGSTTFNVPDLRGRVVAGKDNMGGTSANRLAAQVQGATLGATGGAESHTLTISQIPAHNHGVSDPTHTHGVYDPTHAHSVYDPGHSHSYNTISTSNGQGSAVGTANNHYSTSTSASGTGIGIYAAATGISIYGAGTGITTQNNGSGLAHNNTQPTIVLNQIIKT